ncbi:BQ5605_C059g12715 [Microbotryum silenes-dioicae]|uniref:BQ5605_C059g12715 protein n=1 Tax=Microbotryum silenes-dioicae TaxID=796604 RepID=A0A2X0PNM2_9BASI|nr:BQ5605_C059g12715 [Microbotryum silenes-dioicae]
MQIIILAILASVRPVVRKGELTPARSVSYFPATTANSHGRTHDLLEKHSRPPYSSERRRQLAKVDVTSGADSRGSELVRAYAPAALSSFAPTFALALTPPFEHPDLHHVLRQLSPPASRPPATVPTSIRCVLGPRLPPQAERCADSHDRSAARCRRPPGDDPPGRSLLVDDPRRGRFRTPTPPYPSRAPASSSSLPLPPPPRIASSRTRSVTPSHDFPVLSGMRAEGRHAPSSSSWWFEPGAGDGS